MEYASREERNKAIIKLYQQKTPIEMISQSFGVDKSFLYKLINKEIKEGRIEKVKLPRKKARQENLVLKKELDKCIGEDEEVIQKVELKDITECEPIRCTKNVLSHCRYGGTTGKCNFLAATGKCRSVTNEALNFAGCSHKACIRFQKIDKEHRAYVGKR